MPEDEKPKEPKTLDALEQELDKDALRPEIVEVESDLDDAPDPRAAGDNPDPVAASDEELRKAANATEEVDDENKTSLANLSLHIEQHQKDLRRPR